ncbi:MULTISPECIES: hypothetical protein [Stenotrophomonas]|uniref:hypothetical protein n=1 Tax=Stenotrophomonas TaxID=40323 RepID=UPI0012B3558B|nr:MULTISPECIES: hypothetical protein [Stenotrophomonas]MBS4800780.1 hypothetical protein [Stenotrophomonas maltophilia]MDG9987095.1 hypothetical protein [Stenotrophomonas sp. GD04024]
MALRPVVMKNNVRATVANEFQWQIDGRVLDVPDADIEGDSVAIKDAGSLPLAAGSDFKVRIAVRGSALCVADAAQSHGHEKR